VQASSRSAHAQASLDVVVAESSDVAADAGRDRIEKSLPRAEAMGKIDSAADVFARIRVVESLDELADRDIVIESIVEEEEAAKIELFRQLDTIVTSPEAILASNSSAIPIMKLRIVTSRPQNVLGIHFVDPLPGHKHVESYERNMRQLVMPAFENFLLREISVRKGQGLPEETTTGRRFCRSSLSSVRYMAEPPPLRCRSG